MRYLPHTPDDVQAMLGAIGVGSMDELFAQIPEELRLKRGLDLPGPMSELQLERHLRELADRNKLAARSFLGVDVETIACLPRIERVESSARASYPAAECPGVAQFTRELERARSDASLRFDAEPVAAMPLPMSHATESAVEPKLPAPAAPVARIPAPAATSIEGHAMHTGHAGNTAHTPSHATPHAHPAAAQHAHAQHAPARPAPAFAALPVATLPAKLVPLLRGLRPLGIACPVAPDVELALDDDRRMHIVGRSDQLARVRTARTWATMHRELLGLALAELIRGHEGDDRRRWQAEVVPALDQVAEFALTVFDGRWRLAQTQITLSACLARCRAP
jgi:hypothetical protein